MTTWTRAERIAPTTSSATMAAAGGSKTGDAVRGMCQDINNTFRGINYSMFICM